MRLYTILIDHIDTKTNKVVWTSRSWTKKLYDSKDQAIEALSEMRKNYNSYYCRYRLVEVRIVNEFDI